MGKFRKKPVEIEAIQFDGSNMNQSRLNSWLDGDAINWFFDGNQYASFNIITPEGVMEASVGDWIIQGIKGEFYPCKPDIFDSTYEIVD